MGELKVAWHDDLGVRGAWPERRQQEAVVTSSSLEGRWEIIRDKSEMFLSVRHIRSQKLVRGMDGWTGKWVGRWVGEGWAGGKMRETWIGVSKWVDGWVGGWVGRGF